METPLQRAEYDEQWALAWYIWQYFPQYVSVFEWHVAAAARARRMRLSGKLPSVSHLRHRLDQCCCDDDLSVAGELEEGEEAFRWRVCQRVMVEHGTDLTVHRCPRCASVLMSPRSLQCLWCGHVWPGEVQRRPPLARR